jgi:hypothetical protein
LTQLGDALGSREARKESRSLGIFKGVSKTSDSPTTPPATTSLPEDTSKTLSLPPDTSAIKPVEKTTKTTATYYPKLTRQDPLIPRKDSAITTSTVTRPDETTSPPIRKEVTPSSALAGLNKSGYESESGDEGQEWNSPQSVALKPYSHQVGGHSALFRFSRHAVCKPLIEKENAFYQDIEINRPECTSPHSHCNFVFVKSEIVILLGIWIVFDGSAAFYATVYRNLECHTPRLSLARGLDASLTPRLNSLQNPPNTLSTPPTISEHHPIPRNNTPSRSPNRQKPSCTLLSLLCSHKLTTDHPEMAIKPPQARFDGQFHPIVPRQIPSPLLRRRRRNHNKLQTPRTSPEGSLRTDPPSPQIPHPLHQVPHPPCCPRRHQSLPTRLAAPCTIPQTKPHAVLPES